jgi:hypothetical protein
MGDKKMGGINFRGDLLVAEWTTARENIKGGNLTHQKHHSKKEKGKDALCPVRRKQPVRVTDTHSTQSGRYSGL